MRSTIRAVVAVALLASLVVLGTRPASAGGSQPCTGTANTAPDGRIKLDDGNGWLGANDYAFAVAKDVDVDVGETVTFTLRWRNLTSSTKTIRVQLLSFGASDGMRARFFLDGVKFPLINGGKLMFAGTAPGSSTPRLQLVVKNKFAAVGNVDGYFDAHFGGQDRLVCDRLQMQAHHQ